MSILSKFTVTPLLWTCAVLVVLLGASSLYAYKLKADVTTAEAATKVATGERDQAVTRATELESARQGWSDVADERLDLLNQCQAENTRIQQSNADAVAKAQAEAKDAARTLDVFMRKYQIESRKPDCDRARHAMAAACPALEDY